MTGVVQRTGYQILIDKISEDLINHGFGEFTFKVVSSKTTKVKIEIHAGRYYVFWIEKDIKDYIEKNII